MELGTAYLPILPSTYTDDVRLSSPPWALIRSPLQARPSAYPPSLQIMPQAGQDRLLLSF